jgi:hypothetical protein
MAAKRAAPRKATPRKVAAKPVAAQATAAGSALARPAPAERARASATAMQERIATLEDQVQNFIWCWAERDYKMQVAAIKQMLSTPQAQEKMAQVLLSQAQAKSNGVPALRK